MLFRNKSRKRKYKKAVNKVENKAGKESGSLRNTIPLVTNSSSVRASLSASLTVEAAMVLPIFLYLTAGLMMFFSLLGNAGILTGSLQDTAKRMGIYAHFEEGKSGMSKVYMQALLRKGTAGLKGIHLDYSSVLEGDEKIDLAASYRVSVKVPVFSFGKPQVIQRGCVRAWTGRDFREKAKENTGSAGIEVYVAENGTVYHRDKACTHLKLSVRQVSAASVKGLRNRYGEKYYACGCCKEGIGGIVYITNMGNRYHAKRSCSGLKRTVHSISLSDVENLPPCSKCGG